MSDVPTSPPTLPDAIGRRSPLLTQHAFLVHSPNTFAKDLPPDVDNKPLARQKRRRTRYVLFISRLIDGRMSLVIDATRLGTCSRAYLPILGPDRCPTSTTMLTTSQQRRRGDIKSRVFTESEARQGGAHGNREQSRARRKRSPGSFCMCATWSYCCEGLTSFLRSGSRTNVKTTAAACVLWSPLPLQASCPIQCRIP
jgi:hypothetical protein